MREIKFRAWDKKHNRFWSNYHKGYMQEYVDMHIALDGGYVIRRSGDLSFEKPGERFELMQYTGLKDKKGVDIYEGDIVKYNTGEEWTVQWSPMYLRVILADNRKGYNLTQDLGAHEVEVIGNIYENPELLPSAA